jgi:hypothetical protein
LNENAAKHAGFFSKLCKTIMPVSVGALMPDAKMPLRTVNAILATTISKEIKKTVAFS